MKSEREVNEFRAEASRAVTSCKKCGGALDVDCVCTARFEFEVEAFEACIPRSFWNVTSKDIRFNRKVFRRYVKPYVLGMKTALRNGYGLCFSGPNGVGKTMFISYVLLAAMKKRRSVYYTTMLQLDHDIKSGFSSRENSERLELMLTSDFLAIDEMGKEQIKAIGENTYTKTQLERILKRRFDDSRPILISTNLSMLALGQTYGDTIMSMVKGKLQNVRMEAGDVRIQLAAKMRADMGYTDEGGA